LNSCKTLFIKNRETSRFYNRKEIR